MLYNTVCLNVTYKKQLMKMVYKIFYLMYNRQPITTLHEPSFMAANQNAVKGILPMMCIRSSQSRFYTLVYLA